LNDISRGRVVADHQKEAWYDSKMAIFRKNLRRIESGSLFNGRILDLGCGYGTFIKLAQDRGWKGTGVEVAQSSAQYAKERLGLNVFNGTLKEAGFDSEYFDALTLWEVLGLFPDPSAELREALRVLKKGGLIALRWHNSSFYVFLLRLFRFSGNIDKKLGLKPTVFHLYNFSPKTLKAVLEKTGFTDVRITVAEPTEGDPYSTGGILGVGGIKLVKKILFYFCNAVYTLTAGRVVLGSALLAFARRPLFDAKEPPAVKVLHIITRLDKGGSAQNTLLTAAMLDKKRFNVVLASGPTNDPDNEISGYIDSNKIKYVFIPDLVRSIDIIRDLKAVYQLYRLIKKNRFDIVHTHTSKAGILGRWAAWFAGTKIIIHTPHGHIFYGYFGVLKTRLFILLEQLTGMITTRIITLTELGITEHLKYKIAPRDKFCAIFSGIDFDELNRCKADRNIQRNKLHISGEALVIGTVSRLEPVKGNLSLIQALPEVIKSFPGLRVVIAGDGSQKQMLQGCAAKLGISANLIFTGSCGNAAEIMCALDIFVLASLNEGMGKCLLEAQSLGIPVVATDVGGIPEVVRDGVTGILVKPSDPRILAQAIIKILKDNSLRKQFSVQAKEWAGRRFSAGAMVSDIGKLYESVINK